MGKPTNHNLLPALESQLSDIYQHTTDKEPPHCSNAAKGMGFCETLGRVVFNALVVFSMLIKSLPTTLY